jgi:hypothetical protein
MKEMPNGAGVNCEWFLNELEGLPAGEGAGDTPEVLLLSLPEPAQRHAASCAECKSALEDFAETRSAFAHEADMSDFLPEPGPWFIPRVMNAIAAEEAAIEERQNGFWIGVRRLAPRLVAFATLVLMLGGTWAFEERRSSPQPAPEVRPAEGIFESYPVAPVNDDVLVSENEVTRP